MYLCNSPKPQNFKAQSNKELIKSLKGRKIDLNLWEKPTDSNGIVHLNTHNFEQFGQANSPFLTMEVPAFILGYSNLGSIEKS